VRSQVETDPERLRSITRTGLPKHLLTAPGLLFVGSLLLQFAWIIALPPFEGIDEFDHAYRAAAVAHGDWGPSHVAAANGRGDLVTVPRTFVEAATPACTVLTYTGFDNCHPVQVLGDGMVTVASAAASYNPAFYWVIGTPARLFSGSASLYAMRVVASLICSLLLALAGWVITLWSKSRWPMVAVLTTMTPVAVYSTALGAPNGVEMIAGLGVWAALIGLYRTSDARVERLLIYAAVPNAVVLVTVRTLGPLWLALIVLAATVLIGVPRVLSLSRRHGRSLLVASLVVLLAVGAGLWWTRSAGTNSLTGAVDLHNPQPLQNTLAQIPLWIYQSVAAFPRRFQPAPVVVYACAFVVLVPFLLIGLLKAAPRLRIVLSAAIVVSVLIPFLFTLATYSHDSALWQGRYVLPFALGFPLLAAAALDATEFHHRLVGPLCLAGWCALLTAQLTSVLFVLFLERRDSGLAKLGQWHGPSTWLVAGCVAAGFGAWALAVASSSRRAGSDGPSHH
jgi:Predicted membrane protein (DUF2142)